MEELSEGNLTRSYWNINSSTFIIFILLFEFHVLIACDVSIKTQPAYSKILHLYQLITRDVTYLDCFEIPIENFVPR